MNMYIPSKGRLLFPAMIRFIVDRQYKRNKCSRKYVACKVCRQQLGRYGLTLFLACLATTSLLHVKYQHLLYIYI
jgi:hypothetical protein